MAKMITEPTVVLIAKSTVEWAALDSFLQANGLPPVEESIRATVSDVAIVEAAARICYESFGKGRRDITEFINNLLDSKDGSVFEHVSYTFAISGVSRSLSHELVRHRAGFAFSQRSQRYVDESEAAFVVPPAIKSADAVMAFDAAVQRAQESYLAQLSRLERALEMIPFESARDRRKAVRQAARALLPNATETKLVVTGNVRAWRWFIEARAAPASDWEIRRLAVIILRILQEEAPLLFGDFSIDQYSDGTEIASPKYSKV